MILAGPASLAALLWVAPAAVSVEPAPAPVPAVFEQLADCESGGDWSEGDGGLGPFRGGLQWHPDTWPAVKPAGAPDDPAAASAEQEVAAARNLLAEPWGGWHHWPVCARKIGLLP